MTPKPRASKVLASSPFMDVHALRPGYGDTRGWPATAGQHPRKLVGPQGQFAMQCIERWALVAGEQDGEDSAGRAKLRRMTADEVVHHACQCAAAAFAEFERRGWVIDIPSMAEMIEAVKDQENTND